MTMVVEGEGTLHEEEKTNAQVPGVFAESLRPLAASFPTCDEDDVFRASGSAFTSLAFCFTRQERKRGRREEEERQKREVGEIYTINFKSNKGKEMNEEEGERTLIGASESLTTGDSSLVFLLAALGFCGFF